MQYPYRTFSGSGHAQSTNMAGNFTISWSQTNEDAAKRAHVFIGPDCIIVHKTLPTTDHVPCIISMYRLGMELNVANTTCDDDGPLNIQCEVEPVSGGSGEDFPPVDTEIFWSCKGNRLSHDQSGDQSTFGDISGVYHQNETIIIQNFLNQTIIYNQAIIQVNNLRSFMIRTIWLQLGYHV